jgi:predicted dehydrogenase
MVRMAVVGAGVMGANHLRILALLPSADLVFVVDSDANRAEVAASRHGCRWSTDVRDLFGAVDGAVLAVPSTQHYALGIELLEMGLHVLIEKPIASSVDEARRLIETAERGRRILAVGHVERFNPVCLDLPRYVESPVFVQTRRLSSYDPRIEDGVARDMLIHDADLVLSLAGSEPMHVGAVGLTARSKNEDLISATVTFESGLVAQLTAGRIAQSKIRQIDVIQDGSMVTADLLRQDLSIRRQTTVELVQEGDVRFRETSIVEIPFLSHHGEPLWLELENFVDAVAGGSAPLVDGHAGLAALALCEEIVAAARSTSGDLR